MIEVLARDRILAAEEGPPHRALDAVINADFRFFNQVASRQSGHGRGNHASRFVKCQELTSFADCSVTKMVFETKLSLCSLWKNCG